MCLLPLKRDGVGEQSPQSQTILTHTSSHPTCCRHFPPGLTLRFALSFAPTESVHADTLHLQDGKKSFTVNTLFPVAPRSHTPAGRQSEEKLKLGGEMAEVLGSGPTLAPTTSLLCGLAQVLSPESHVFSSVRQKMPLCITEEIRGWKEVL